MKGYTSPVASVVKWEASFLESASTVAAEFWMSCRQVIASWLSPDCSEMQWPSRSDTKAWRITSRSAYLVWRKNPKNSGPVKWSLCLRKIKYQPLSVVCLLKASAANAGASGFQMGVLEAEGGQISAQTQRVHQRIPLFLCPMAQNFAKDWR